MSPKRKPRSKSPSRKAKPDESPAIESKPCRQVARASLIPLLRIAGLGFAALSIAALLIPGWRGWAFHHVGFLPPWAAIVITVAGILFLTPIGGRGVAKLSPALRTLSNRPAWLWAILSIALFWGLKVDIPLLGDGQLWIRELTWIGEFEHQGREIPVGRILKRKEPLSLGLHEIVFETVARPPDTGPASPNPAVIESQKRDRLNYFRDTARDTYVYLSILAGALILFLAIRFARRRLLPESRSPFLLTLFAGGGILLFFGYVENYTWTSVWIIACLLFGLEESLPPRRFPWKTGLCFVIAVGFHYSAIVLAPAVLYLLLNLHFQPSDRKKKRLTRPRYRERLMIAGVVIAGLIGYVRVEGWKGWISVIPLLPRWSKDGYSFVSPEHGIDLLNLIALVAPAALVIRLLIRPGQETSHSDLTREGFLNLAAGCGLVFIIVFKPNLGMARDWDLLAAAAWPLIIAAAWKLAHVDLAAKRPALIAALLGFIVLIPLPSVIVNAAYAPSIARFKTLLEIDHARSAYGWENLALHYQRRGEIENRVDAWRHAMEVERNPRYVFNYADALKLAGRIEEADPYYIEAAIAMKDSPTRTYREQLRALAVALVGRKRFDRAKFAIDTYRELMPDDTLMGPRIQMMVRDAAAVNELIEAGAFAAAREAALEARARDPRNSYWVGLLQEITQAAQRAGVNPEISE